MFRTIALRLGPGAEALPEDELRARCKAFRFKLQGGGEHSVLLCNGVPVGPEIRTEEVGGSLRASPRPRWSATA